jgi:hypothetical protein
MASVVYSYRFFEAQGLSAPGGVTFAPGYVYVVRCIDVHMGSQIGGAEGRVVTEAGAAFFWFNTGSLSAGYAPWRGRQVFQGGEGFQVIPDEGVFDVVVSGYQLSLP